MEKKYFKLQLKSIFKVFPAILLITVLTISSIGITGALVSKKNADTQNGQKISLGLVGNMDDAFLSVGIHMVENVDNSRFYLDLQEMDEETAIESLEKRKISGYLYIPKNYFKNVYNGNNVPARYVTLNEPTGFGSIISDEIAMMISGIVTESQNGMYCMQDFAFDLGRKDFNKHVDKLSLSYLDNIAGRKEMYEITTIGIADELSFAGYYICGILVMFMLLWGVSCNRVFTMKNSAHARLLRMSGMKGTKQILCEYGAYLFVTVITMLVFALCAGIALNNVNTGVPELELWGVFECISFVVRILPVIIMITIMHMAIYELIQNPVGAILALFLISIFLGYLSGCFYPNYFFPDLIQKIVLYLPVGTGFSYVRQAMTGGISILDFCIVLTYIIAFFAIAIKMRNYKITGDIK